MGIGWGDGNFTAPHYLTLPPFLYKHSVPVGYALRTGVPLLCLLNACDSGKGLVGSRVVLTVLEVVCVPTFAPPMHFIDALHCPAQGLHSTACDTAVRSAMDIFGTRVLVRILHEVLFGYRPLSMRSCDCLLLENPAASEIATVVCVLTLLILLPAEAVGPLGLQARY